MRRLQFFGLIGFIGLIVISFISQQRIKNPDVLSNKSRNIVRCSPDWNYLNTVLNEVAISPLPGAGNYKWKIYSTNDSAQFYFNQGINLYYGFHIIEAFASFKKAASFDPDNAMIWWGQALAYGPNINDVGYQANVEALKVVRKAESLKQNAQPFEQVLIEAMVVRYSDDSTISRERLNQAYAEAMKKAYIKYKSHPDVSILYADALMLQHPWNLWYNNGQPKAWTPQIRSVLEDVLKKHPIILVPIIIIFM